MQIDTKLIENGDTVVFPNESHQTETKFIQFQV